jgi:hypothetical protein
MPFLTTLVRAWLRGRRRQVPARPTLRLETLEGRSLPNATPLAALHDHVGPEVQHRQVEHPPEIQIEWGRSSHATGQQPAQAGVDVRQEDRQGERQADQHQARRQAQPADPHQEDRQQNQQEHGGNHR